MRVLFFVEPVAFRHNPLFLAPHLAWIAALVKSSVGSLGPGALVSSAALCQFWLQEFAAQAGHLQCFELDGVGATASFGHSRAAYCAALYAEDRGPSALRDALLQARRSFSPDLVVLTSQNAYASQAFDGVPMLWIEQAPLPRMGQPMRMCADPSGHQVHSVLESHMLAIRRFALAPSARAAVERVAEGVARRLAGSTPGIEAIAALQALAGDAPVALLATQPQDWVTYEGALGADGPEVLLPQWAEQLPPGWIGVPTYHPDWQLAPASEATLRQSSARLRFLPPALARGTTEALLTHAQGLVTISSTAAMTALLLRKRVVTVGRSPFAAWGAARVDDIADSVPLSPDEAVSAWGFLCHRYAHNDSQFFQEPGYFASLARAMVQAPDPTQWLLDGEDFSVARLESMFTP